MRFDSSLGSVQLVERHDWVPVSGIEYFVGVDGLGLLMVLLTAVVVPMSLLAGWGREGPGGLYLALVLFLEAGLLGTFTALELLPLVFVLGAEPDPGLFLDQTMGRPGAVDGGGAIFCVYAGGEHHVVARVSGLVSGAWNL
jgi:NADH-quinone oxidoreductase subunit M